MLIIFLVACETVPTSDAPILLPELPVPTLTGDDNRDIASLVVQDVMWRLLYVHNAYIVGAIDEREYNSTRDWLLETLEGAENAVIN